MDAERVSEDIDVYQHTHGIRDFSGLVRSPYLRRLVGAWPAPKPPGTLTDLDQFPIDDLENSPKDNVQCYKVYLVLSTSVLPPVRRGEVAGDCP